MIASTACWKIALFSWCLFKNTLEAGSFPQSLVGLLLEYLNRILQIPYIHMMNLHGHGRDSLVWLLPLYDLNNFSVLAWTITHLRVSSWQGGLSYHFPAVTRTVYIYPSRFFITRFYSTFINIFCYLHVFKHFYSWFKSNGFTIKSLHICLIDPDVRRAVQQNSM